MKRLEEILKEVQKYSDFLGDTDIESILEEIRTYAREVAQASLEKAAENARTKTNRESTSIVVDKESITNEQNITLL
ncbi:hypothetical protein CMU14_13235 [Elizabethkingia anophelis]|nr:hypothetical protein [Elizabethkingia anophelis]